jgi:hypothetical protein
MKSGGIRVIVGLLFVTLIWWHLLCSEIPSLSTESSSDSVVKPPQSKAPATKQCAPRDGVIIVNFLGLLANNLFEVAFALRLAQELCWKIVYRPFWNAEFPSKRGRQCFPNAQLPRNFKMLSLGSTLQDEIQLNASTWYKWAMDPGDYAEDVNKEYQQWVEKMSFQNKSIAQLAHLEFDFTGNGIERLVNDIYSIESHIQVVSMEAFFIHYDWMKEWMPRIRQWLSISPTCCQHDPPRNAVVMHVRDFNVEDGGYNGLKARVYTDILHHYHYTNQPLWIVCQPKTANSPFVKEIVKSVHRSKVTIVTGVDQYDAFCTLTRAKTLVLSYVSSFSQMAALLNNNHGDVKVHYPLTTLDEPEVTLAVPGWKYHLVNEALDGIKKWNVGYEKIKTKMA